MPGQDPPVRTCIGCRASAAQGDLLRISRSPGGLVLGRTKSGRSAYVHADLACIEAELNIGALAEALRANVNADEVGRLGSVLRMESGAT